MPASASLLARLAVARLAPVRLDAAAVSNLRIGDFACGTGAPPSFVADSARTRRLYLQSVLFFHVFQVLRLPAVQAAVHFVRHKRRDAARDIQFSASVTPGYVREITSTARMTRSSVMPYS